ncbi:hypothetical protein [Vreelandella stevensii]|uniref:hypothetical protein n=1 Tax=Vreelandella stevensii TaxID=502821 RepID=UPI0037486A75
MLRKLKEALFGRQTQKPQSSSAAESQQSRYTIRDGQLTPTDQAFDAWTSRDLAKMRAALDKKTNLVDRHFLLMTLVDETYKRRKEDLEAKEFCAQVAEQHLEEFPDIKPALVKSLDGILPRVTTFQKYATLLTEEGEYKRAIEVCEIAISHGLNDGTKGGFEGRIAKIKKKAGDGNA